MAASTATNCTASPSRARTPTVLRPPGSSPPRSAGPSPSSNVTPDDCPWPFPGGHPGRPLTDSQIGKRLHSIGIRPKQDRSTALFPLATELPAAILARMLGVHTKVAVQWQKASVGDRVAYAADVSQRVSENQ
ncbi:hypothetical protein [Streptomyces purpurascens]